MNAPLNPKALLAEPHTEMIAAVKKLYTKTQSLINCIKYVRGETGWTLKEAKDWVEAQRLRRDVEYLRARRDELKWMLDQAEFDLSAALAKEATS